MSYQEFTKENGKYDSLAEVSGEELIGLKLSAPLSLNPAVYALPMMTIKEDKGTFILYL